MVPSGLLMVLLLEIFWVLVDSYRVLVVGSYWTHIGH